MASRPTPGYYRHPTLFGDTLVFVSEDDLFEVPVEGGLARRLTASPGRNGRPRFSPDGAWIAYASRDEGHTEVWAMPAGGGESRRLTFTGGDCEPVAFEPGGEVVFASGHQSPFETQERLFATPVAGGPVRMLPWGPATEIAYGPAGEVVLGRNTRDPARWKRYRGGTIGQLWLDAAGTGDFRRLDELEGNLAAPMWLGDRLYFLSDREGHGNLWSCAFADGRPVDVRRHTAHTDFYVRNPTTDGRRIAYHAGGDLWVYDAETERTGKVEVVFATARAERQRRFVDAAEYLQGYDLHPKGHSLAVVGRGSVHTFGGWEGPVMDHGETGARQRLARWLPDGERLVMVTDAPGEETLEIRRADGAEPPRRLGELPCGRATVLEPAPYGDRVVLANHRNELWSVRLGDGEATKLDQSEHGPIDGLSFSPDGRFLAYAFPASIHTSVIRVVELQTGEVHDVTRPVLYDDVPAWDPKGRYLYLLSTRTFEPVHDGLHFDLGFPKGERPYLVTLRKDVPSPFVQEPRPLRGGDDEDEEEGEEKQEHAEKHAEGEEKKKPERGGGHAAKEQDAKGAQQTAGDDDARDTDAKDADDREEGDKDAPPRVEIDFDGITSRMLAFPVPEGRYLHLVALEGKVLWTQLPLQSGEDEGGAALWAFDFEKGSADVLTSGVSGLRLSLDRTSLCVRSHDRLRVVLAGEKPPDEEEGCNRRSGWVDLSRVNLSVDPVAEWRQMYREAWRLQRDHFWNPGQQVDWQAAYERYLPLLERVGTRSEFSDLMWEMQGELGTSHAYEFGGDYRPEPAYVQGHLGADFAWVDGGEAAGGWRIERILEGDPWDPAAASPLAQPGLDVREGDLLLAVNGRRAERDRPPQALLLNQVGTEVGLTLKRGEAKPHVVTVRSLGHEGLLRYRAWVERNRRRVHDATGGRVGYVHVPDMADFGYGEFHRGFLPESERDALVVDVRHNGGGHVSQLLLEKLMRRRVGWDQPRYGAPVPYPQDSPGGPLVCVTDELAGSDGDVFSHAFKLLKLGPLVGRRTWGGVVGIWPRHTLVDGGITTQPEFAFWFEDVGWKVENYGTEPDIEVEIRPQDWAAGADPQLDRAVQEALEALERNPPRKPDLRAGDIAPGVPSSPRRV